MTRLLLGFIGLLLVSCSAERADTVSFKPEKGDEYHYRVYGNTVIDIDSSRGSEGITVSNDMLLGYKVVGVGDVVSFDISIDALKINGGGTRITNLNADREPAFRALMSQGFAVDVRLSDNKVTRFTAKNEKVWQAMLQDRGEQLQQELHKMMQTPGVSMSFPAKVGHSFKLAGYFNVPEMTLTVNEVTEQHVLLQVEATETDTRLFGYIRLHRDNGWIDRMAVLTEMPFDDGYSNGKARSVVLMIPQKQYSGDLSNLDYYSEEPYEYTWPEDFPSDWLERANRKPTEGAIFSQDTGVFSTEFYEEEALRLRYPHQMMPLLAEGALELTELRFLDIEGKPLPIETAPYFSFLASWFNDEYQSITPLNLKGWDMTTEQLARLDSIEAEAVYHYAQLKPVSLPVQATESSVLQYQDISARLEPLSGEKNTFFLTLTSGQTRWFSFYMGLPAGTMVQMLPEHHSDQVAMSVKEARLLSLGKHSGPVSHFKLIFKEIPTDITLYVNEQTGEISSKGKLRFINEQAYATEDYVMPLQDEFLYQEDQFSQLTSEQDVESLSLKDMPLPQPDNHALTLTLSAEQAALCELTVVEAPDVNGHTLRWQQVADNYYYSSDIKPKQQRWQLTSEDGIRQYFYDMKVTSRLQCDGDPQWTALPHNQRGSFWRLDITELDPELDVSMPLSQFIARYRFLNRNHKALALAYLPQQYEGKAVDEQSMQRLQSILIDGRWLKIAGRAVVVEKLQIQGQAISREWTAEFAPLP